MREILFKGKRIDNKEWVYGAYSPHSWVNGVRGDEPLIIIISNNGNDGTCHNVIPETVCQYTGLTDKNGRKIFEGDIVLMPSYQGGKHRSVVYFKNGKFAVNGSNYHFKDIKPRNIEVIGNIFDNLELMEV